MKCIVLAKMGRRIFAAIIDFLITLGVALALFFALIMPLTIDEDTYNANTFSMNEIKIASRVYVNTATEDVLVPELIIDVVTSKLSSVNDDKIISHFNSFDYKETKISVIDSLVRFYIEPPTYKGENIFNLRSASLDAVKSDLFKVGSSISNIKDVTLNNETNMYEISLIDVDKKVTTVDFISSLIKPDNIETTTSVSEMVINCSTYKTLDEENRNMMLFTIVMIIPALFGSSLIFYFLIPICSKNGETIGKYLLGLGVLSADGYVLKRYYHIPRFLSLFIIEMAGGILSFGGLFLISYILFCFNKKRRSIHDFVGNSVVIDKKASVWFVDKDQEYKYNYKTRIN